VLTVSVSLWTGRTGHIRPVFKLTGRRPFGTIGTGFSSPTSTMPLGRSLLLAALVLGLGAEARGQALFDRWSVEDGLPQNSVNDIVQTRDGYLWLATYGGLVRFDGLRFVVFDRSTDGINSLRIRTLYEDRAGRLWAATDDGMVLRYWAGRFDTFGQAAGVPADRALRIEEDAAGVIWITWLDAVSSFNGESFVTFAPGAFARGVRPHREQAEHFGKQTTWWSVDADGLHCLASGVVRTCLESGDLSGDEIVGVSTEPGGTVWVRLRKDGLLRVRGRRVDRIESAAMPPELTLMFLTGGNEIVWAVTAGHVYRVAGRAERLTAIPQVLSMFEDREGSLWIGASDGLRRLRAVSIAMRNTRDGLSSDNVYAVLRDRRGDAWVGTWGAGLNRYDGVRFRAYTTRDGLRSDFITALHEDASGRLWVGTRLGVTIRSGDWFIPYDDPQGWLAGQVWAIHEDRSGNVWFGTDQGLVRNSGGRFVRFTTSNGLPHDRVFTLLEDADGALWVGTSLGLARFEAGRFEAFTEKQGFIGNHVRALYQDADRTIWAGTYDGGLYRLKGRQLTRYTTREGLYDNGIFQILEDDQGYFWMGSNRGLQRVSRDELNAFADGRVTSVRSTVYGLQDGLTSLECNGGRQPSGQKMPDGTIWIPTQGGIAVVNPLAVRPVAQAPPVLIEEFRIGGDRVSFASGVTVPANRPAVEIRFTAVTFVRPEQARFRYRLVGLDEGWVDAGISRAVAYHRLPPGEYQFEVIAANSDGVWNRQGDTVAIVVLAPIWQRVWFLSALTVLAFALVVAIERRRVFRLRREHASQQAYTLRLLETQETERRRISNELHDSLGQSLFLIRRRARSARCDVPPGPEGGRDGPAAALDDIEGLAASAYDEMKQIAYDLRPYELDKIGACRTIKGMLRRVSSTCDVEIVDDVEDVDGVMSAEAAIHVFRIVQEAINNVIRHAGATKARVAIRRLGDVVEIEVSDDGQGFDPGAASANGGAPGLGLAGIKERARRLAGRMAVHAVPGHGTRLTVTFPVAERAR